MAWLARHPNALPERMVRGGFLAAADVTWALHIGSVRQLERNLAHVLSWRDGTDPDRRTLRKLSRKGMRSYFTYFSEAMTVGARSKEQLLARIHGSGDGFEAIKHQAGSEGTGSAPIAMGHQGNWDYDGFWAQFDVAPVTTVAEKLANREMLDAFVSIREHLGMTIFLTGTPKLTERLEEALRTPHTLVPLLADRDLSGHANRERIRIVHPSGQGTGRNMHSTPERHCSVVTPTAKNSAGNDAAWRAHHTDTYVK